MTPEFPPNRLDRPVDPAYDHILGPADADDDPIGARHDLPREVFWILFKVASLCQHSINPDADKKNRRRNR